MNIFIYISSLFLKLCKNGDSPIFPRLCIDSITHPKTVFKPKQVTGVEDNKSIAESKSTAQ
jgi:hypothetical protein